MYQLLAESKILIVDDFAGFRQTIKMMLHRLGGHDIEQAGNGYEAVKLCSEQNFDLIFCDYNLGQGQDGQQVLEELHHRSILKKGTLFLMVTAETTTAQVMGAIEYRPDAYLTKPFTGDQLAQRLKRLMNKNKSLNPLFDAINAHDLDRALALSDELIAKVPRLKYSCLRIKSELLEQLNKYDEALLVYQEVASEQPILWALMGIGRIYYETGDTAKALEYFLQIKQSNPDQVSLLDWIAKCQKKLGDIEKAEETLCEAIKISPKSVTRQAALGSVATELEHFELAQKSFSKTLHEGNYSCMLKPEYFEHYYDNTRKLTADLPTREKSKLLAESDQVYKNMKRIYDNDPTALAANLSSIALLYSETGQAGKSSEVLSKLSKTLESPDCKISTEQLKSIDQNMKNLGEDKSADLISSHLSKIKENIEIAQNVVEKPVDPGILARQVNAEGLNLTSQGKHFEALLKFREAIKISPDNVNFMLNAAQIIIEKEMLFKQAKLKEEARMLLQDKISIDESDIRWNRYQKLLSRI